MTPKIAGMTVKGAIYIEKSKIENIAKFVYPKNCVLSERNCGMIKTQVATKIITSIMK